MGISKYLEISTILNSCKIHGLLFIDALKHIELI